MRARRVVAAAVAVGPVLLAACEQLGFNAPPGAQSVLEGFAPPSPSDAVQWAMDPFDPDNRYRGTLLLARAPFAGERPYLELFLDNSDDPDPAVRAAAVRALAAHGDASHVPVLITRLRDDPDPAVRAEAARALQRIHSPDAIIPLVRTIELNRRGEPAAEPDPTVRAEAAHALGQYARHRVFDALVLSLMDPSLAVNRAALESLRTLTGQDFGFDRRAWVAWREQAGEGVFAARRIYVYPTFWRPRRWIEWLPLVPPPPNEAPDAPVGMPRTLSAADS